MRLRVLGASCAAPNRGEPTSGYLLQGDHGAVLLECGHGTVASMLETDEPRRLTAVVISHLHPDHFADLFALRSWFVRHGGVTSTLPLFLPPGGVDRLRAVCEAMGLGSRHLDAVFRMTSYEERGSWHVEDLAFESFPVSHGVTASGFRVRHGTSSMTFTGDTAFNDRLLAEVTGSDVVLAEMTRAGRRDGLGEHMGPDDVAMIARHVGAGRVVVTHYDAQFVDEAFRALAAMVPEPSRLSLARKGMLVDV